MLSSTMKAWILGLLFALGAVGFPQRVEAASHNSSSATTQRARRHFLQGKRAFEAKRYSVALKEFETGYAIVPRPGFLLNMGTRGAPHGRAEARARLLLEIPGVGSARPRAPHDDRAGRPDRSAARGGAHPGIACLTDSGTGAT